MRGRPGCLPGQSEQRKRSGNDRPAPSIAKEAVSLDIKCAHVRARARARKDFLPKPMQNSPPQATIFSFKVVLVGRGWVVGGSHGRGRTIVFSSSQCKQARRRRRCVAVQRNVFVQSNVRGLWVGRRQVPRAGTNNGVLPKPMHNSPPQAPIFSTAIWVDRGWVVGGPRGRGRTMLFSKANANQPAAATDFLFKAVWVGRGWVVGVAGRVAGGSRGGWRVGRGASRGWVAGPGGARTRRRTNKNQTKKQQTRQKTKTSGRHHSPSHHTPREFHDAVRGPPPSL